MELLSDSDISNKFKDILKSEQKEVSFSQNASTSLNESRNPPRQKPRIDPKTLNMFDDLQFEHPLKQIAAAKQLAQTEEGRQFLKEKLSDENPYDDGDEGIDLSVIKNLMKR